MEVNGEQHEIAYFRENPHTDQCELVFHLKTNISDLGEIDEEIKAVRQRSDTVASLLQHIKNKLIKLLQDKFGQNNQEHRVVDEKIEIPLALIRNKKAVKNEMHLRNFPQALSNSGCVFFIIFDQSYIIMHNAPLVKNIKLPAILYANYSIQPKFHAIYADNGLSNFTWYRSKDKTSSEETAWEEVGKGFNYLIQEEDIGYYLKLVCFPVNKAKVQGPPAEAISENAVEKMCELPQCPFEERHTFTKYKLQGKEFRIVTYNILAEKYTSIDENYNYCDPKFLAMDYRKQLILRELVGYNADIICLQEVDNRHYSCFFREYFKENGYMSYYHRKGNRLPEGLAIFFNKARFKSVESKQIVFSDEIQKRRSYSQLWDLVRSKDGLRGDFLKQSTSLQVTVFKIKDDNSNRHIIVANTHLYYHPDANHIRLIQIYMATSFLSYLKKRYQQSGVDVSIIFCGDFNSSAHKSLYPFMLKGQINPTHEDCLKINENSKAILHHEFIFESACGTPIYTNYTPDFKGCLDYIFIESNKMAVTQMVPLTSEEELAKYDGLPNKYFPSDHLALVVDLKFKY